MNETMDIEQQFYMIEEKYFISSLMPQMNSKPFSAKPFKFMIRR